jgi:hypothetical protein
VYLLISSTFVAIASVPHRFFNGLIKAFRVFEILLGSFNYALEKSKVIGLHVFNLELRPYLIFAESTV